MNFEFLTKRFEEKFFKEINVSKETSTKILNLQSSIQITFFNKELFQEKG